MVDIIDRLLATTNDKDNFPRMGSEKWLPVELAKEAVEEIKRLREEISEWRECAKYDPMMEGPRFKGWDRSQMDRCRKRFIE